MHRDVLIHGILGINGLLGVLGWNAGYRAAFREDVASELIAAKLMNGALGIGPRPSVVLGKVKTGRVDVAILVCDSGNGSVAVLESDVDLLGRLLGLALIAALLHRPVLRCDGSNAAPVLSQLIERLTSGSTTILPDNTPRAQEFVTLGNVILRKVANVTGVIGHPPITIIRAIDNYLDAMSLRLRCGRAVVALSKGRGHRAHHRAQGQHSPQACCDCDVFAVELHAAIPPCSLLKRQTFLEGGHIVG